MDPSRRQLNAGAVAIGAGFVAGRAAARTDDPDDMTLGSPDAPATVIEYVSPTSPHCALWHRDVFPEFKSKYVDTGRVRFVMREFGVHGAIDIATFMVARCAGRGGYFSVIEKAFVAQADLDHSESRNWVFKIGRSAGMDDPSIDRCLADKVSLDAFQERQMRQVDEFQIQYVPSFVINGRRLEFDAPPTVAELSAIIDPLLEG